MKTSKRNKLMHKPSVLSVSSFIVLLIYSVTLLAIMAWALVFSFTDFETDIFFNALNKSKSYLVLPSKIHFENYKKVYDWYKVTVEYGLGTRDVMLPEMFLNSILYAVGVSFMSALAPCLMGYVGGRYKFKFVKVIDTVVLVTMVLPIISSLPSQIRIVFGLGLDNSFLGLWIMAFGFAGMYYFVFKATFSGIPFELSEAAHIDGANNFQIFIQIIMPVAKTTFLTVMLLGFVSAWNNYETPLVFAPNKPTAALGLFRLTQNTRVSEPTLKMTGAMLLLAPILILFIFLNKHLMGNLTIGSVKG